MKYKVFGYLTIKAVLVATVAIFVSSAEISTSAAGSAAERSKNDKGAVASAAPSAIFTNSAPITINDEDLASPYPSAINVTGLGGNVTSAKVTINGFSHTFPDDVGMVLVGPTGAALLLQDGAGDDPDMVNITYTFVDGSPALPNLTAWAAGNFKPTTFFTGDAFPTPGPGTAYGNPGPAGAGTATFASVFNGTAPNGNWNLFVVDFVAGDFGSISGGWTLEITTDGVAAPAQHVVDLDGDGKTDFVNVRNTGGGPTGQVTWFGQQNGGAAQTYFDWGIATDEFVPEDYDGDGKTDIAIWRQGAPGAAAYYIFQSQTSTVRAENFGQTGDDPTIVGDYDGDGKADVSVYRSGAASGDPSNWYWRTVINGPVFGRHWGQNGDFPAPGDYDGDGKDDFGVQRNNGGGQAAFYLNFNAAAPGVLSRLAVFGTPTDVIVPGDYDGDGKTDIATVRGSGGSILWHHEPSSALGTIVTLNWGLSATDFPTQGDYDGDGKTDLAVWRPNADPTMCFFYARKSSDGGLMAAEWGSNGDYPVANFDSH
jgi:subtilisin-like proprotein convertase family protein